MERRQQSDEVLRVRLPADLKKFLAKYAQRQGTTMSAVVRLYVSNLYNRESDVEQF